jgi:hypothetical protein
MDKFCLLGGAVVFFLLFSGAAFAEPVVKDLQVSSETRDGKVWTNLAGTVEAWTDLPVDRLLAVITDWPDYPRIFSRIQKAEPLGPGSEFLMSEVVTVSILGFPVTNRFTLRMQIGEGEVPGSAFVRWTQGDTDGTIDHLVGGWELIPTVSEGKPGTLIRYRNASSVIQSLPGQELVVRLFFPGELKDAVASAIKEARRK